MDEDEIDACLAANLSVKGNFPPAVAIDDSAAPIKDEQGNLTRVVLVFRDVTERRRAEVQLQRQKFRPLKPAHRTGACWGVLPPSKEKPYETLLP